MLTKPSKIISFVLCFLLIFEQSGFAQVETQNFASLHLSAHLISFHNTLPSDKYRPLPINDDEVYENILNALEAEIDGNFKARRYTSPDYLKSIDEIILIEAAKLPQGEQIQLQAMIEQAQGETIYEKLQTIEGFDDLKNKVIKIKNNWEKNFVKQLDNGWTIEFTDDFFALFNLGNSKYFDACQNCVCGSDLNRGLTGYTVNGTNKAIVLLDENRRVVTRRVIRFKIFQKEGNRSPCLLVEESTQFGSARIDELYDLLEQAAGQAGLPVMASQYRPAQTEEVLSGQKDSCAIELYRGRSTSDYSDLFGSTLDCYINAGLYRQTEPVIITKEFELIKKQPKNTVEFRKEGVNMGDVGMPVVSSGIQQDLNYPREIILHTENKQNVPSPGGIDFTVMPTVVHPVMSPQDNFKINPGQIVSSSLKNIKLGDGDEPEWLQIQKMVHAGIIPSSQRIKEYLVSSCVRGEFNQEMDKVICCIFDIFRLEEERLNPADSGICEILKLIESDKSADELQVEFSKIVFSPRI